MDSYAHHCFWMANSSGESFLCVRQGVVCSQIDSANTISLVLIMQHALYVPDHTVGYITY